MNEEATAAGRRVIQKVMDALDENLRVDVIVSGLNDAIRVTKATANNLTVEMVSHNLTYHLQTGAIIGAVVRASAATPPNLGDLHDDLSASPDSYKGATLHPYGE
ncbi:hypothetical protein [Sphingomonas sp. UYP23]